MAGVSGFNLDYYLQSAKEKGFNVGQDFSTWANTNKGNMDWRAYVRDSSNTDLQQHWQAVEQPAGVSRLEYGQRHWDTSGKNENRWATISGPQGNSLRMAFNNGVPDTSQHSGNPAWLNYAQMHYLAKGQGAGAHPSESSFFSSPEQTALRDQKAREEQMAFERELENQRQAAAAEANRVAQAAAAQRSRTGGSSPVGTGGNADFRGSRLSITKPGGKRGTSKFGRGPSLQYNPQMAIAGSQAGASLQKKQLNV